MVDPRFLILMTAALLLTACSNGPFRSPPGTDIGAATRLTGAQAAGAVSEHGPSLALNFDQMGPGCGGQVILVKTDPGNPRRVFVGSDVAGLWRSDDHGRTYRYLTGRVRTNNCSALAFHPSRSGTYYIGTEDGVFVTRDDGESWSQIGSIANVGALAVVGGEGEQAVLFAGTGYTRAGGWKRRLWQGDNRLYRFNWNGRGEWESFPLGDKTEGVTYSVLVNPDDRREIWLSTLTGVCVSDDGGRTWQARNTGLPAPVSCRRMIANPADFRDKIVTHAQHGPYRLEAGTWKAVNDGLPELKEYTATVNVPEGGRQWGTCLYVASDRCNEARGLFCSRDAGRTWQRRTNRRRIDFGWHPANHIGANPHSLHVAADGWLWLGKNGNFFACPNPAAENWRILQKYTRRHGNAWAHRGMVNTVPRRVAPHPNDAGIVWMAEADRVLWESRDGGASFRQHGGRLGGSVPLHDAFFVIFDPLDPEHLYAGASHGFGAKIGDGGLYHSTDGGATWSPLTRTFENTEFWSMSFSAHYEQDGTMYSVRRVGEGRRGTGGGVHASTDGGRSWRLLGLQNTVPCRVLAHPSDPDLLFVCTRRHNGTEGLWRGTRGEEGWKFTQVIQNGNECWGIAVDPHDPSVLFCAAAEAGLWRSEDRGETWRQVFEAPGGEGCRAVVCDPITGYVYTCSDGDREVDNILAHEVLPRLVVSRDRGENWERIGGLPNPWGWHLNLAHTPDGSFLYVATKGLGSWRAKLPAALTTAAP